MRRKIDHDTIILLCRAMRWLSDVKRGRAAAAGGRLPLHAGGRRRRGVGCRRVRRRKLWRGRLRVAVRGLLLLLLLRVRGLRLLRIRGLHVLRLLLRVHGGGLLKGHWDGLRVGLLLRVSLRGRKIWLRRRQRHGIHHNGGVAVGGAAVRDGLGCARGEKARVCGRRGRSGVQVACLL